MKYRLETGNNEYIETDLFKPTNKPKTKAKI